MKNITVIADKPLRKQAIKLVHSLSKIKDVKAAYWTPKQLKDNEITITGRTAAILLGKTSESEPYLELIKPKMNRHGVIWGFDGPKAAVFIESNPQDSKALANDVQKLIKIAKLAEVAQQKDIAGNVIAFSGMFISGTLITALALPLWLLAIPYGLLMWILGKSSKNKRTRKLQYAYGLMSFSQEGLDEYLGQLE